MLEGLRELGSLVSPSQSVGPLEVGKTRGWQKEAGKVDRTALGRMCERKEGVAKRCGGPL